ncbi:nucleotidyltransferase [Candidatus Epulonipiscioides gigas]|nr:nucleotidyltransferase [Epulopiscium sp. SCG-C07WGA-EpuloA2]ONI46075.1 nucleotidyltransferase [Epulopiscium sp. SCG-C07WGA-EpuloA2]
MTYDKIIISNTFTVKEAIKRLDDTAKKILFVATNNKLEGTITDGDIRRWILKNGALDADVTNIMNKNFKYILENETINDSIYKNMIIAVPVLNSDGEIMDIHFVDKKLKSSKNSNVKLNNKVIIMAGGKGTRLYPYTQILPKPLIPIGEKSILERIFDRFNSYGCTDFILTLNYKKGMIKSYLEELDVPFNFSYIEEENFYGTAGSLSLLKGKLQETFFVSNCDILIDANYAEILQQHQSNQNKITLVTSLTNYIIPYGVVITKEKGAVSELKEKPEYNFQINTGVYVLEPEVLNDIPENTFFHITDLISMYIKQGKKVGVYPIRAGQWLDMGEIHLMQDMIDKIEGA